ncbi:hypothetical protein FBUS_00446 [Fasciolopsis buskii]|uniref:Gamma-tubulin complex component n=1 Tax=Fasciolopsis buskii TaxID=27845 RepID=A0A8E0S4E2_9TREM|nr:hypothetical protein FBUS_00446 [Fasciolopsis buski]
MSVVMGPSAEERKGVFPRHWDYVQFESKANLKVCSLLKNLVIAETQPEYWWRRNSSTADCFRNTCLDARDAADVRNELTEYQIIREVIWALLGGRTSYVFRTIVDSDKVLNNRFVLGDRANLATISIEALDSLLAQFARSATHGLLLRTLVDFVFGDSFSLFHPCVLAFANGINTYLSQLDHFLLELQDQSRGPSCFTLANLYARLLPWNRRTGILAGLVMRVTAGRFDQLRSSSVQVQILDVIHYVVTTFDVCTNDRMFLNMLQALFLETFQPFLHTTVYLLSGAASVPEYLCSLFADPEVQIEPTHPSYWSQAFTWYGTDPSSLSRIPQFLHPVLSQLLRSIKALCMLVALANRTNDNQILRSVLVKSEDVFNIINISSTSVSSASPMTELPGIGTLSSQTVHSYPDDDDFMVFHRDLIHSGSYNEEQTQHVISSPGLYNSQLMNSIQAGLYSFIHSRCDAANRCLVSVLLSSPPVFTPGFQYLGIASAAVGSVYLFGAGDRLNDFARDLFQCVRSSEPWYRDYIFCITNFSSFFRHQIKYVKWILETLRFVNVQWLLNLDGIAYQQILLLRSSMIFVFAGLHDFVVHRIEATRIQFIQYWSLPDVTHVVQATKNENDWPGDLSHLIDTHHSMLMGLKATCLLTPSAAVLRRELETLLRLPLILQSLWSPNPIISDSLEVNNRVTHLNNTFFTHVNFLASLLAKSVRLSNMRKLCSLAETFRIAASFRI